MYLVVKKTKHHLPVSTAVTTAATQKRSGTKASRDGLLLPEQAEVLQARSSRHRQPVKAYIKHVDPVQQYFSRGV